MTRWQQKQHQLQHQQFPANSHTKPSHIADVALTTDCGRREGTVIQHEVRKSNKKQVKKQQMVFQTPKRHFKFPYLAYKKMKGRSLNTLAVIYFYIHIKEFDLEGNICHDIEYMYW